MKDVVPLLVSGGHQHLPLVPQVLSEDDQLPPCPGQKLQPDVFRFDHQDHNLSLTPPVLISRDTPPPALPLPRLLPVHPVHPPGTAISIIQQGGSVDSGTGLNLETQNLKITNKFTIHACLKLIKLKKYILVRSKLNFFTFSHFYIFLCLSFI